ncbi:MAG: PAS domain-containing protein [candidate division KSB1 bacterium]|nr:PAS domain-containing protein [candidate division KSB1 bacterium]
MSSRLAAFLRSNRDRIVHLWATEIQRSIPSYRSRPLSELLMTTGKHLDATIHLLESGSYERLHEFMHEIAPMRIQQGFRLSDIQRAFLVGKRVISDLVEQAYAEDQGSLYATLHQVEEPFHQTVLEYSDIYQELQVKEVERRSREALKAEEERRLLEQVQAEREKLDRLVAAIGADIAIIDRDMRVVWHNRYLCRGEADEEVKPGTKCDVLGWHTQRGCEDCATVRAFRSGHVEQSNVELHNGNGQTRYFQIIATPLRGSDGSIAQVLELVREVTDIRELERRVDTQQEFLEAVSNDSADAIVGLDAHNRIIFWNKGAEAIFEYPTFEILHKRITVLTPPGSERRKRLRHLLAQVRRDRYLRNIETILTTKAGREVPVDVTLSTICDDKGRIIGYSSVIRDISERKRLEEKVLQAERLATVGRMAAKVAHDIRNPLSSISLNVELLGDEVANLSQASREEIRDLLNSIASEVDRLAQMSQEYLEFARIPKLKLQLTDVNQLFQELLRRSAVELAAKGIQVCTQYREGLPQVRVDRAQMYRALQNLLRNAIEAMPNGGTLTLATEHDGQYVQLRVADTGVGIEERELPKIFEPFHSTKEFGTGLGLTITRHVVEEHGGSVQCTSTVGVGSEFVIFLPIRGAQSVEVV